MHEECAEIGLIYYFGIPNVIKNEYIRLAEYAPQDSIKAILYNGLYNANTGGILTIQKFHEENDLWIRGRQKRQAEMEKKQAIKIMKKKKLKVEIPEGYEVIDTVEHRYREAFPNDSNEHITHITVNLTKSKKELPKTWEELETVEGYWIIATGEIQPTHNGVGAKFENKNIWPTKELAEAALALSQLCQLRDHYNDGWMPDWKNADQIKYGINFMNGNVLKDKYSLFSAVLSFKTPELRDEFLKNLAQLIETAKPLL